MLNSFRKKQKTLNGKRVFISIVDNSDQEVTNSCMVRWTKNIDLEKGYILDERYLCLKNVNLKNNGHVGYLEGRVVGLYKDYNEVKSYMDSNDKITFTKNEFIHKGNVIKTSKMLIIDLKTSFIYSIV